MLEVKNLSSGYGAETVIRNITFTVGKGESLCILGPNGCGKSTLLKAIARIIDYSGLVTLETDTEGSQIDIKEIPRKELAKKIAMLEQTTQMHFPYTVYETVSMGRYTWSQGFFKNLSTEDKEIIKNILIKLDIWDIKDRMIDELSGGTLQRVFLARTLAQTPDIILLDEPANHLDLKHQIELLNFLKSWVKENNKALIGVFHDLNLAYYFGDTALVLNNSATLAGTVAAYGKIDEVLTKETLTAVYGVDVCGFMREVLGKWDAR